MSYATFASRIAVLDLALAAASATGAAAQGMKIDSGDTASMLAATGLVLLMTIPGLALFYRSEEHTSELQSH